MEKQNFKIDPQDAELRLILESEVEQQLQIDEFVRQKLIYLGDYGDWVYFCFDCLVKA